MKSESPNSLSNKIKSSYNLVLVATVNDGHGTFNDIESDHECIVDSYQLKENCTLKEDGDLFDLNASKSKKKLKMEHIWLIIASVFIVIIITMKGTDIIQKHSHEIGLYNYSKYVCFLNCIL